MDNNKNIKNLRRRDIRYICARLQTEADGGNPAKLQKTGPMVYVKEVKSHIEDQDDFGGWRNFAKTWDVDEKAPLVVVTRSSSIQSDWNKILRKQAKELPVVEVIDSTKVLSERTAEKDTIKIDTKKPTSNPTRDSSGRFVSKAKEKVSDSSTDNAESDEPEKPKKKSFWNF